MTLHETITSSSQARQIIIHWTRHSSGQLSGRGEVGTALINHVSRGSGNGTVVRPLSNLRRQTPSLLRFYQVLTSVRGEFCNFTSGYIYPRVDNAAVVMEAAVDRDGSGEGGGMKLPVERIYSTNWWNRTDDYSNVHFAISLRLPACSLASDKRQRTACNFPWKPKPLMHILGLGYERVRVALHRRIHVCPTPPGRRTIDCAEKIVRPTQDRHNIWTVRVSSWCLLSTAYLFSVLCSQCSSSVIRSCLGGCASLNFHDAGVGIFAPATHARGCLEYFCREFGWINNTLLLCSISDVFAARKAEFGTIIRRCEVGKA